MDLEVKVRFSQMGWEAPGCRWFTGLRVHTVLAQCPVLSVPRCLNGLTGNTQRQVRKSRVSSRGWIRYTVLTGGLPGATAALPTAFSAVPLKAGLFEITPKRGVRLDRGLDVESPPPTAETYARYNTTANISRALRRAGYCASLSLAIHGGTYFDLALDSPAS